MKRAATWIAIPLLLLALIGVVLLSTRQVLRAAVPALPHASARISQREEAPNLPAATIEPAAVSTGSSSQSKRLVTAPWGSGPGALGRSRPQEGNPEMPMSFALAPDGRLVVLDQVNRRLAWFDSNGRFEREVHTNQRVPQDVALAANGSVLVLDRLRDKNVAVIDRNGRQTGTLPLEGSGVKEAGGVTGVFSDGRNVYVEYAHAALVDVGTADGTALQGERERIAGRPSRDGQSILSAGLANARDGTMWVNAISRTSMQHRFTRQLQMTAPVSSIEMLDSDRRGTIYVGARLADGAADGTVSLQIECLEPSRGEPVGAMFVRVPDVPDETFRAIAARDEGGIVVAVPTAAGMEYWAHDCM